MGGPRRVKSGGGKREEFWRVCQGPAMDQAELSRMCPGPLPAPRPHLEFLNSGRQWEWVFFPKCLMTLSTFRERPLNSCQVNLQPLIALAFTTAAASFC